METPDFSWALRKLREGHRVARMDWEGGYMYVKLQVPDANSKMNLEYIYMWKSDLEVVPWLPTQCDLLSDDWVLAD